MYNHKIIKQVIGFVAQVTEHTWYWEMICYVIGCSYVPAQFSLQCVATYSAHIQNFICGTGLPEVTVIPSSQTVEVTHTANFTINVSGVGKGNFTYQWQRNGVNISETKNLSLFNVDEVTSGYYTCIVTNQYGDTASDKAYLGVMSKQIIA